MNAFKQFRRDERGAAAIEFAIAAQVLVALIWGIFQVGLVFQANAGMQHALGEAARLAVIYPYPGDTALTSKVTCRPWTKASRAAWRRATPADPPRLPATS